MKILSIGNSFSEDAQRYLHRLAKHDGVNMKTVNLYIGGCSLRTHYLNMLDDNPDYEFQFNGEKTGLKVKVVGSGSKVTSQLPAAGSEIDRSSGVIVLYMGDKPTEEIIVPDLVGKTSVAANQILINLGLNIKIEGVNNPYVSEGNVPSVFSQSIAPGTKVAAGSVVTVEFRYTDADEDPHYRG